MFYLDNEISFVHINLLTSTSMSYVLESHNVLCTGKQFLENFTLNPF